MTNWYSAASRAVHSHYAGQNVDELAMLLRYLDEQQPASIIEIGTWEGGTAWAFAQLPSVDLVVSIDRAPRPGAASVLMSLPCRVHMITADSTSPATVTMAAEALAGRPADVVFIDGGHDFNTAYQDWENYRRLAGFGGLVVLHDTQGHPDHPDIEVPKLWSSIAGQFRTLELVAVPGGPYGTGIVWP